MTQKVKDIDDTKCLEVNSSYMPLKIITSRRAFIVHYKGNAEVITTHPTYFATVNSKDKYPKPSIIRIPKFVEAEYSTVPFTRGNIFRRDNHSCVYCGNSNRGELTIDHVIPVSKGGKDNWNNLVTACVECNAAKSDLTLEEWGKEDPQPYRPHALLLMQNDIKYIPDEWKDYLFL